MGHPGYFNTTTGGGYLTSSTYVSCTGTTGTGTGYHPVPLSTYTPPTVETYTKTYTHYAIAACPTSEWVATYTVTEQCTGDEKTWSMPATPPSFTTSTVYCDSCQSKTRTINCPVEHKATDTVTIHGNGVTYTPTATSTATSSKHGHQGGDHYSSHHASSHYPSSPESSTHESSTHGHNNYHTKNYGHQTADHGYSSSKPGHGNQYSSSKPANIPSSNQPQTTHGAVTVPYNRPESTGVASTSVASTGGYTSATGYSPIPTAGAGNLNLKNGIALIAGAAVLVGQLLV